MPSDTSQPWMTKHPALSRNHSISHQQTVHSRHGSIHHNPSAIAPHPPVLNTRARRTRSFNLPLAVDSTSIAMHSEQQVYGNSSGVHDNQPLSDDDPGDEIKHTMHQILQSKTKSRTGVFTGLFSCLNPHKRSVPVMSASKKVAALLEISRRQQSELANKQDTIDMLEWQIDQMQAMEKQMEANAVANEFIVPEEQTKMQIESYHKSLEEKKCYLPQHEDSNTAVSEHEEKFPGEESESKCSIMLTNQINHDSLLNTDRNIGTLALFEMATVRARFAIRSFSKALIKQLEASGYSVLKTLTDLEPNVVFTRKEHVVYALESRINRAFYHCFENDNFDNSGIMQILNPAARCAARLKEFQKLKLVEVANAVNSNHPSFNEDFRKFCERKTRELWSQFSWSITFNTVEERDMFTAAFLDAAKGVWLLHKLAFSLQPHVVILRVGKGLQIDPTYVEAVPELVDGKPCSKCLQSKVEFLIVPGFQALEKVIKCQVYQHIQCS